MNNRMQTLSDTPEGRRVRVVGFTAGRGLRNRLAGLGIFTGQTLEVLRNSGRGPVLVEVMGRKIGLGRGESQKILVEEV
jgi:ferrous iron transport protein A